MPFWGAPKPFDGLSRNLAQLITSATAPDANVGVNRFQGGVSARAWNCRVNSGVYFFSFLGPISTPLTAQTTRPVGIHISYMVWIIKINIFPIFTQKSEKFHYGLRQLRRAVTPAPFKIRARCLHQTGGFWGRTI